MPDKPDSKLMSEIVICRTLNWISFSYLFVNNYQDRSGLATIHSELLTIANRLETESDAKLRNCLMDEILKTWKELGAKSINQSISGKYSALFSLEGLLPVFTVLSSHDPCYGIVKEYSIRMLRRGFSRKGWASINGS